MNWLPRLGRYFFAFAMGAFSVQYFLFLHHPESLVNIPPYSVVRPLSGFLVGLGLLIAAVCIASGIRGALASKLLGAAFLLDFLIFHVAQLYSNLASGNLRTRAFETLTLAGAAFGLGAIFSRKSSAPAGPVDATVNFGRLLVTVSLVIFGVQHFMYHTFIASLIPAWMPARIFLAYFTGAAFLAAALSFATGRLARVAGLLLALMLFIWVIILHAPLVAHSPHSANLWSSMFVAFTMCAVGLIIAESFRATT